MTGLLSLILAAGCSRDGTSLTEASASPSASPSPSPSSSALPLLATSPCRAADLLVTQHQLAEAKTAFVNLLTANPAEACAVSGLLALAAQPAEEAPTDQCAIANSLADFGYPDEANEIYLELAKKDPKAPCLKERFAKGLPHRLLDRGRAFLGTWLPFVVMSLGAVLALLALLLVPPWAGWRRAYRRFIRRFVLTRWFFRPRLAAGAFEDGGGMTGSTFYALVQASMKNMQGVESGELVDPALPGYELDLVSGLEDIPTAWGGLTDLSPQFKLLAGVLAFIQRILPFTRLTVTGALAAPGDRGSGVILSLQENNRSVDAVVLWERSQFSAPISDKMDDDGVGKYYYLVPRAAGWLHYQLTKQLTGDRIDITQSAEGYAYFRGGVAKQQRGFLDAAEELYESALELDGSNYAALTNLARIAALRGDHSQAVDLLERAISAREDPHG